MDTIYNRFKDYVLKQHNLISPDDKILLSISAGKDSMFMLHLIKELQNELGFQFDVFHLNHLTRGEESDKDELFIKKICEDCGIHSHIERYDFTKNKIKSKSFEEHAREIRYSLLKKISATNNYSLIATAHNMNDNSETLLMRILSGTGINGIRGILPKTDNLIRPILFAKKDEIYKYLRDNNIAWREDLTNKENIYLRNHVRNIIIPMISERFPMAEENLINLSNHAIENQSLLTSLIDRLYPDIITFREDETIIDVHDFKNDMALIKFLLSKVLLDHYGEKIKIKIFNEIIKRFTVNAANIVLYEKGNFKIRKGLLKVSNEALIKRTIISISNKTDTASYNEEWEYTINPDNKIIIKEIMKEVELIFTDYEYYSANKDKSDIVFIQSEDFQTITIRNRRAGDRIKTEIGTKKIKELMIEKKLDMKTKNSIPLILIDNAIAAYIPDIVIADNNKIAGNYQIKNNSKRILAFFFKEFNC
jgi:tRNA(Ile)-lysidine synthase